MCRVVNAGVHKVHVQYFMYCIVLVWSPAPWAAPWLQVQASLRTRNVRLPLHFPISAMFHHFLFPLMVGYNVFYRDDPIALDLLTDSLLATLTQSSSLVSTQIYVSVSRRVQPLLLIISNAIICSISLSVIGVNMVIVKLVLSDIVFPSQNSIQFVSIISYLSHQAKYVELCCIVVWHSFLNFYLFQTYRIKLS